MREPTKFLDSTYSKYCDKQAAASEAEAELAAARQQLQRERADAAQRVAALAEASLRAQVWLTHPMPSDDLWCDAFCFDCMLCAAM